MASAAHRAAFAGLRRAKDGSPYHAYPVLKGEKVGRGVPAEPRSGI